MIVTGEAVRVKGFQFTKIHNKPSLTIDLSGATIPVSLSTPFTDILSRH
jgi:hypothetical protein